MSYVYIIFEVFMYTFLLIFIKNVCSPLLVRYQATNCYHLQLVTRNFISDALLDQ